jgi:hypothetical protein
MNTQPIETKLLASEEKAKAFVEKYTVERCERVLNAIGRRFDRRYELACEQAAIPLNREWIRKTDLEVDLMHRLKIGLTLLDDYSTPMAARLRQLKRISEKGGERGERAQEKLNSILNGNLH